MTVPAGALQAAEVAARCPGFRSVIIPLHPGEKALDEGMTIRL
jgi:hypothetical protein